MRRARCASCTLAAATHALEAGGVAHSVVGAGDPLQPHGPLGATCCLHLCPARACRPCRPSPGPRL